MVRKSGFGGGGTELLGNETARKVVPGGNTLVPVQAVVEGLHPHQTYHYGLTAYDENVHAPEPPLTSENESFTIPSVPPRVLGTPSTPFLHSTSAVLFAELNPENTGTRYTFQYATTAACEGREREAERHVNVDECGGVLETGALESNLYGQIGATLEAVNLQPATGYRYRLVAENEEGEDAAGEEASFTTPPVAALQASTEPAGTLGVTSALLLGQVDPDGVPATYSFEVGVYAGPATQYGIVLSGPTGAGGTLVEKEFLLTGLQPGTKYSYRISISSPGYGSVQGEPVQFTTAGLSEVLPSPTPLAFLPPPPFTFPKVMAPAKCRSGYKLDKHGKCIKKKKRSRKKRKKASHVKVRRARRSSWGAAPGWKEWRG